MFIVFLRSSGNRAQAGLHLEGHRDWIRRGLDDGVFLVVGSLQPDGGGAIVAHNTSLAELQRRVEADPFVAADVVRPEIVELAPSHADERLSFVLD